MTITWVLYIFLFIGIIFITFNINIVGLVGDSVVPHYETDKLRQSSNDFIGMKL